MLAGTALACGVPFWLAPFVAPPWGMASLAAYLRAQGSVCERWRVDTLAVYGRLNGNQVLAGPLERAILDEPTDVLGLSCFVWDVDDLLELARRVKAANPALRVVAGGPACEGSGEAILREHPSIDAVVEGEGESSLLRLLDSDWFDLSDLPGLRWRDPDGRVRSNDGRSLVLPFEQLFSPLLSGAYSAEPLLGVPLPVPISAGRGCANRCAYCAWARSARVRMASQARLERELLVIRGFGQGLPVLWTDSALNRSELQVSRVCGAARAADPERSLLHYYSADLRSLTREQLQALSAAMTTAEMGLGVNTLNPRASDLCGRSPLSYEEVRAKVLLATEYLPVSLHVILGLPGDDLSSFQSSFDRLSEILGEPGCETSLLRVFWFQALPGTGFRREHEKYGLRFPERGIPYSQGSDGFPEEDLWEALRWVMQGPMGHCVCADGPESALRFARPDYRPETHGGVIERV